MASSDQPAERHRQLAAGFTDRVLGTRDWDGRRRFRAGGPGTWCGI